jgi:hypothetical protein
MIALETGQLTRSGIHERLYYFFQWVGLGDAPLGQKWLYEMKMTISIQRTKIFTGSFQRFFITVHKKSFT